MCRGGVVMHDYGFTEIPAICVCGRAHTNGDRGCLDY